MVNTTMRVDARGLSCPQPVLLARAAVHQLTTGVVEVLVDSVTSRENISRWARSVGCDVTAEAVAGGDWRLTLTKCPVDGRAAR